MTSRPGQVVGKARGLRHVPELPAIGPAARRSASPPRRMVPSSGRTRPRRHLMRVDLPAPLGPTSAVTRPDATWMSTPSSAVSRPNRFRSPWNSTAGTAVADGRHAGARISGRSSRSVSGVSTGSTRSAASMQVHEEAPQQDERRLVLAPRAGRRAAPGDRGRRRSRRDRGRTPRSGPRSCRGRCSRCSGCWWTRRTSCRGRCCRRTGCPRRPPARAPPSRCPGRCCPVTSLRADPSRYRPTVFSRKVLPMIRLSRISLSRRP